VFLSFPCPFFHFLFIVYLVYDFIININSTDLNVCGLFQQLIYHCMIHVTDHFSKTGFTLTMTHCSYSTTLCVCVQANSSKSCNHFLIPSASKSSLTSSPLSASITPTLFHSRLETYLSHKSTIDCCTLDCLHG